MARFSLRDYCVCRYSGLIKHSWQKGLMVIAYVCLSVYKWWCQEDGCLRLSNRARGSEHKLEHRKFYLNVRNALLLGLQSTRTGSPERWWGLLL